MSLEEGLVFGQGGVEHALTRLEVLRPSPFQSIQASRKKVICSLVLSAHSTQSWTNINLHESGTLKAEKFDLNHDHCAMGLYSQGSVIVF